MKLPLVSVVIPTYNEENYVNGCVKTLLKQSYKAIEIIFVDDGSTDLTLKILEKFAKKEKRLKVFKQNHEGPGKARNLGAKKAKGEILIFVDADMEFDKDYIKVLIKPILEKKTIGTIHSIEYVLNKDSIWARFWGPRPTLYGGSEGRIFRAILKKKFFEYGGFDSKYGYADDQTIWKKTGIKSLGVDAICYHKNPASLREVYKHSRWIGAALEFKIMNVPFLNVLFGAFGIVTIPVLSLVKALRYKEKKYFFHFYLFAVVKYFGYFAGVLNKTFLKRNLK